MRTLHDWAATPPGRQTVTWDGRDDSGAVVRPGLYQARVQARYGAGLVTNYATGWVGITG